MRARRKPPNEEQQRRLITRGGALAALAQHPSWPDMQEEVKLKEEKLRSLVLTMALSPNKPIDQRQADFVRGFIAGINWFVAVPDGAASRLETYLREHGIAAEEGEAS
jgi:hypothetical protein